AADKHLEHDAAVGVEKQHRCRQAAHEGALDKGNTGAALVPQMAVKALAAGHIVIAASDLAGGNGPAEFHDPVVSVHDQGDIAPGGDIPHGVDELAAGR